MKELKFRDLKADEIECKVSTVSEKGCSLLLYKTARTDMDLLDETVGAYNWKCSYREVKGNMYCTISIYDEEKKEWIDKEDCGVESAFGDKEKGEASDAFKRAGFKLGIGRELYTAPFIWVKADDIAMVKKAENGKEKYVTYDKFYVEKIKIENKRITALAIKNQRNERVYVYMEKKEEEKKDAKQ